MDIEVTLKKWDITRKKLEILEEKLKKYKSAISKELNRKEVEKLSVGDYIVTRRRNTRTYITKDKVPEDIWNKYSTRCSYDVLFLSKRK